MAVGGRALRLSNLDKLLYPATPKSAVVDYYARVTDTVLPHLAGRPLTLRRFPDGVDGESFYEKNAGRNAPDWLRTVVVPTPGSSRGSSSASFLVVEELATLVLPGEPRGAGAARAAVAGRRRRRAVPRPI